MKPNVFFAATAIAVLSSGVSRAETPDYILSMLPTRAGGTNLQISVFTIKGKKIGFALGCEKLAARWTGITQRRVHNVKWNEEVQSANVVADIDCKEEVVRNGMTIEGSTKKFQSKGEPGSFVITYRDGTKHLHFVDHVEWFKAVDGKVTTISPEALRAMTIDRGPDFQSRVKTAQVPPSVPEPPKPNPKVCFAPSDCISLAVVSPSANTYANKCNYQVELSLDHRCNSDNQPFWRSVITLPASGNAEFKTHRTECPVLGGNTQTITMAKACK